ncbi:basic amino acid/polyamine antiporter [Lapidilactobacillus bayanensis]|uniref:basic amino acid/polyamine antiporter n=1 Tax=Lapidilactobacillus bayanensis TaxID=2485998 RepID=UPI000F7B40E4|nr:basic amino acid/polyamine antiporter [Lapidilactobacillus bayanensis]
MDSKRDGRTEKLGFTALTAMVVGSMVGAGIFMLPRRFAETTGVYGAVLTWVIAGAGMLMLAFVFQTLAVRKPTLDAGVFAYAKAGFGDYIGFIAAIGFWASACAGNVTYLVLIKSTLGSVIPALGEGDTLIALIASSVVIWAFVGLILRGVKQAATINTIATVAKLIPIVVFVLVAIFAFNPDVLINNLMGTTTGTSETLFSQLRATMLITVFVFLGIEGASIYSRYAKSRRDVGRATVLGFLSVLSLFALVTLLGYGILPRAELANLRQPSLAGVLEHVVGSWGSLLISVGLIISVLGAYLAWTLMAAEVLSTAAKKGDMPKFINQVSNKGVPKNALLMSAMLTQIILLATYAADGALDFALDLTGALALLPFFLTALYAVKIAITRDGYLQVPVKKRRHELVIASVALIYTAFLIYAAGLEFLLLSCLLLAPATLFFMHARRERHVKMFKTYEKVILIVLVSGALLAIVGLATGRITI